MTRLPALALSLALLSGCTTDGSVDWGKVVGGVAVAGLAVLTLGAAVAASQPTYAPPVRTDCYSWRQSTHCTSY